MITKLWTPKGVLNFDTEEAYGSSTEIFKAVEAEFYDWLDGRGPASEYHEMYSSDGDGFTYLDRSGAVEDAINGLGEEIDERQPNEGEYLTKRFWQMFDFGSFFEG